MVSSAAAACSVAPCDSCCAVELISSLPVATLPAAVATSETVLRSFFNIVVSAWPSESCSESTLACTVRSPSAMFAATFTAPFRLPTMLFMAVSICPSSSVDVTITVCVRSPCATWFTSPTAMPSGRVILRTTKNETPVAITRAINMPMSTPVRLAETLASINCAVQPSE